LRLGPETQIHVGDAVAEMVEVRLRCRVDFDAVNVSDRVDRDVGGAVEVLPVVEPDRVR